MKKILFFVITMASMVACKQDLSTPKTAAKEEAYVYTTTNNFGVYTNGSYSVYNDVWGTGAAVQTLNCNSSTNWNVVTNQPSNPGGVKSYPHSSRTINRTVSSLNSCTSSFNVTVPSGGSFSSPYDIWLNNEGFEIMLWMNKTGNVNPIAGSYSSSGAAIANYTNVNVGGHTWNVYYRVNPGNKAVISFLRTSNTNSGTVDIKAILNWIRNTPKWMGDVNLQRVEYGFEITSGSGTWTLNSHSTSFN